MSLKEKLENSKPIKKIIVSCDGSESTFYVSVPAFEVAAYRLDGIRHLLCAAIDCYFSDDILFDDFMILMRDSLVNFVDVLESDYLSDIDI